MVVRVSGHKWSVVICGNDIMASSREKIVFLSVKAYICFGCVVMAIREICYHTMKLNGGAGFRAIYGCGNVDMHNLLTNSMEQEITTIWDAGHNLAKSAPDMQNQAPDVPKPAPDVLELIRILLGSEFGMGDIMFITGWQKIDSSYIVEDLKRILPEGRDLYVNKGVMVSKMLKEMQGRKLFKCTRERTRWVIWRRK